MIDSSHKIQFVFNNFSNGSHLIKCFRKKNVFSVSKTIVSMKSITWFVSNSLNNIELTQREIILHLSFDSILTVWMRKLNWYAYRLERCLFILVSMAVFFSLFISYHLHSPLCHLNSHGVNYAIVICYFNFASFSFFIVATILANAKYLNSSCSLSLIYVKHTFRGISSVS